MPRKKKTDETPVQKPAISDAADISELEEQPPAKGVSPEKAEDIPFAEVLPESGSDDDEMDVPHFLRSDEFPVISADEADALDVAIEEARTYPQPDQDKPTSDSADFEEQPESEVNHIRQIFQTELAPPPLMVFAFAGIMLIYILAST